MENQSETLKRLVEWFKRTTTQKCFRGVGSLTLAISTDIGLTRNENQDRSAILRTRNNKGEAIVVAVVCDGMGGMESGADCASKVIANFLNYCACSVHEPTDILLKNAVLKANEAIFSDYKGKGGTTLSALCIDSNGQIFGVNVGDSRIYSFDNGELIQISSDDTFAEQLKDTKGTFTGRNELLQHVGIGTDIEPHILSISISKDEDTRLLVTSDGVHFMDRRWISSIIKHAPDIAKAVTRLVELSKWCGGKDNATSIITSSYDRLIAFRDGSRIDVIEIWDSFSEFEIHASISRETKETGSYALPVSLDVEKSIISTKGKRKRPIKSQQQTEISVFSDRGMPNKPGRLPKENAQLDIQFGNSRGE